MSVSEDRAMSVQMTVSCPCDVRSAGPFFECPSDVRAMSVTGPLMTADDRDRPVTGPARDRFRTDMYRR